MSMYTHTTTRARVLANQNALQSQTQIHADHLFENIVRLVVQEVFIAGAATAVAWMYMQTVLLFMVVEDVEA